MCNRNIYQMAREDAGFTQEKASEYLDISIDSLRAYEGERRIPPDKVVLGMIEIYKSNFLAYQHLSTKSEIGASYLPNIEAKDIPNLTIRLLKSIQDLEKLKSNIINTTYKGHIEDKSEWNKIVSKLDEFISIALSLKFAN